MKKDIINVEKSKDAITTEIGKTDYLVTRKTENGTSTTHLKVVKKIVTFQTENIIDIRPTKFPNTWIATVDDKEQVYDIEEGNYVGEKVSKIYDFENISNEKLARFDDIINGEKLCAYINEKGKIATELYNDTEDIYYNSKAPDFNYSKIKEEIMNKERKSLSK